MKRIIVSVVGLLLTTGLWTSTARAGINYIQANETAMAEKGGYLPMPSAEASKHFMHTSRSRAEQEHALPRTNVSGSENPTAQGYERPNVAK